MVSFKARMWFVTKMSASYFIVPARPIMLNVAPLWGFQKVPFSGFSIAWLLLDGCILQSTMFRAANLLPNWALSISARFWSCRFSKSKRIGIQLYLAPEYDLIDLLMLDLKCLSRRMKSTGRRTKSFREYHVADLDSLWGRRIVATFSWWLCTNYSSLCPCGWLELGQIYLPFLFIAGRVLCRS